MVVLQGLRPMNVLCYYDLPPSVLQVGDYSPQPYY